MALKQKVLTYQLSYAYLFFLILVVEVQTLIHLEVI